MSLWLLSGVTPTTYALGVGSVVGGRALLLGSLLSRLLSLLWLLNQPARWQLQHGLDTCHALALHLSQIEIRHGCLTLLSV